MFIFLFICLLAGVFAYELAYMVFQTYFRFGSAVLQFCVFQLINDTDFKFVIYLFVFFFVCLFIYVFMYVCIYVRVYVFLIFTALNLHFEVWVKSRGSIEKCFNISPEQPTGRGWVLALPVRYLLSLFQKNR